MYHVAATAAGESGVLREPSLLADIAASPKYLVTNVD
jgi:hypothetical protein